MLTPIQNTLTCHWINYAIFLLVFEMFGRDLFEQEKPSELPKPDFPTDQYPLKSIFQDSCLQMTQAWAYVFITDGS